MQIAFFLVVPVLLAAAFGNKERWSRAAVGLAIGLVSGFFIGVACGWANAFSGETVPPTLAGGWQAFREIDWLVVGFLTGVFGLATGAGGFFLRGGPSRGVEIADGVWDLWDLVTFWRH